nr:MAG TPA_asm: hypothetical protein [Bacteriophage sp.]DAT27336.1 MAG TPA: hypothetical protein [Caudoviricetes sp.]
MELMYSNFEYMGQTYHNLTHTSTFANQANPV